MHLIGNYISACFSFLFFCFWVYTLPDLLKIIWPTIINYLNQMFQQYQNLKFLIYASLLLGANFITIVAYNLIMAIIYYGKFDYFQRLKTNQNQWPWESNPKQWPKILMKSILVTFINATVISYAVLYFQHLAYNIQDHYDFSIQDWPTKTEILSNFCIYFIFCEITVYWPHYLLHVSPTLYKIHKQHHTHYKSTSIATIDAHPIQFVFSNLLTTALGFLLLGFYKKVHIIPICLWTSYRMMQAMEVHSGYEFSWGIMKFLPGKVGTSYHDFHHSHNIGCFGGFLKLTDYLMQTDLQYKKYRKLDQKRI